MLANLSLRNRQSNYIVVVVAWKDHLEIERHANQDQCTLVLANLSVQSMLKSALSKEIRVLSARA